MEFHPSQHAAIDPRKPAIIMGGSGEVMTYGELDALSNKVAQLFRARGMADGDKVAICLENHPWYLPVCWAAQRSGMIFVPISSRLAAPEISYILNDCGARILIGSDQLSETLDKVARETPDTQQYRVGKSSGCSLAEALELMPAIPVDDERAGSEMLYSSGTTGRPKGVLPTLPEDRRIDGENGLTRLSQALLGFGRDTVYLSPTPMYHSAPIRWTMAVHRLGGTVVIMEKFDPEQALALIERHRVTHSQCVPTHFVRLLALPEDVRSKYDLSTLRAAIHAAAPCPVPVKRAMIEWWGPILEEYYAGTEGNGLTYINSEQWLAHPGSVGRAVVGEVHICDDQGEELPTGETGGVYFGGGAGFSYHNDLLKTEEATNRMGWTTLGDVGRLDEDGFLYLTDRKSFMIISGGVNIYPQEIENLLLAHPAIIDAAVVGAPDPDFGEKVVAVIQLKKPEEAGPALIEELVSWLTPQLSRVKLPREFQFRAELPREPTGKLLKKKIRDEFWSQAVADSTGGMK